MAERKKILFVNSGQELGELFDKSLPDVEVEVIDQYGFFDDKGGKGLKEYDLVVMQGSFLKANPNVMGYIRVPVVMISGGGSNYETLAQGLGCVAFLPTGGALKVSIDVIESLLREQD